MADTASATARPAVQTVVGYSVIEQVFDITIDLAACAEMIDGAAAVRVIEAIDGLDRVVSELRVVVSDRFAPPSRSLATATDEQR